MATAAPVLSRDMRGRMKTMTDSTKILSPSPVVAVGAVIWNGDGEIVLIRRGQPPRKGDWSIPGGRVEWGESLRDAILREVREETGLTVEIVAPIETLDSMTRDENDAVVRHYVLVDFVCRAVAGNLRADSDAEDARWVPFAQLHDYRLWSETRRIVERSAAILTGCTDTAEPDRQAR
jgi:ADP-ribose pyrophosphatase YjhB (NUDIX family)